MLICPVCQAPLFKHEKHYSCENNHTYDIARQGYVNLLLSNQKKTLQPGDNKEMVNSRLRFLGKNHYLPVAVRLNELIEEALNQVSEDSIQIADLGCGAGYYLILLKNHLSSALNKEIFYFGLDISKEAIQCASAQAKDITWIVSSTKNLPFNSNSLDMVFCIFAPSYLDEITRVLKKNGKVYIITPGNSHLKELKDLFYDEVIVKEEELFLQKTKNSLHCEGSFSVMFKLNLKSKDDIENLIKMTPFYWRISENKLSQVFELNELVVTVDVKIWSFIEN